MTVIPSGPAGPAVGFIVNGSGAQEHGNRTALLRFKTGGTVHACVTGTVAMGGNFTLSSGGGLVASTAYDVIELVLDLGTGGNDVYNSAQDHAYSHAALTSTVNVTLTFNHANPAAGGWTGPTAVTWTDGLGCPGG